MTKMTARNLQLQATTSLHSSQICLAVEGGEQSADTQGCFDKDDGAQRATVSVDKCAQPAGW